MPAKRYIVSLTNDERQTLEQLTRTGKAAAAKINHARILLKADVNHPNEGWTDQAISDAFKISTRTTLEGSATVCGRELRECAHPSSKAVIETATVRWRGRSPFGGDRLQQRAKRI